MSSHWFSRRVLLVTTAVVVLLSSALFVARAVGQTGTVSAAGGGTAEMQVVSDTMPFELSHQPCCLSGWQNIGGATLTDIVPKGWKSGLLMMDFSAMGSCSSGTSSNPFIQPPFGACQIRVLVDGQEANPTGDPAISSDYIANLPSYNIAPVAWPVTLDRWVTAAPGRHTIQVQAQLYSGGQSADTTQLELQNWTFSVERFRSNTPAQVQCRPSDPSASSTPPGPAVSLPASGTTVTVPAAATGHHS